MKFVIIFFLLLFKINYAFAYVGPGMAGGVIAAVIGFFVAIVVGIFAILYYPIKKFLSKKKEKDE